jgi:hypothetical protein
MPVQVKNNKENNRNDRDPNHEFAVLLSHPARPESKAQVGILDGDK